MPAIRGKPVKRERPIAPPRNSARSVAMAAISLTIHIAQTAGLGKCARLSSGRVPSRDDAQFRRHGLKQHGDQIGDEDDPEQAIAIARTGLDIRREIARVHIGDGGDEGRPASGSQLSSRACGRSAPRRWRNASAPSILLSTLNNRLGHIRLRCPTRDTPFLSIRFIM